MKPDAEMFFLEPGELYKRHFNQLTRLLNFQKEHRVRLVSFHRRIVSTEGIVFSQLYCCYYLYFFPDKLLNTTYWPFYKIILMFLDVNDELRSKWCFAFVRIVTDYVNLVIARTTYIFKGFDSVKACFW